MSVLVSRRGVSQTTIGSAALKRRAEHMLRALSLESAELSVLVCDDGTIHELNHRHRKKDKATDVLAFALREGRVLPGAADWLGDVVISLDTAARQAEEHGRTLWQEVTMLLAHGLLHLVGYDHRTRAEERVMNARADILIAAASPKSHTRRAAPHVTPRDVEKPPKGIARRPKTGRSRSRKRS